MITMPYDTSVLDRARAERRAEWEQRRQATLARVLAVLDEWLPRYGVTEAYVFGSLAQPGRYQAGSDIDIAVVWHGRDFFDMAGEIHTSWGRTSIFYHWRAFRSPTRSCARGSDG